MSLFDALRPKKTKIEIGPQEVDEQIELGAEKESAEAESKVKSEDAFEPSLGTPLHSHKIRVLRQELKETRENQELRKEYTNRLYRLICIWLIFCGFLLVMCAIWGWGPGACFYLSDKVLITVVTTTTLNVLALFGIVAKWMFPTNRADRPRGKK